MVGGGGTLAHAEKVCVPCMLLVSVKAERQMGAVRRRLDGGGRAGTGSKQSSTHERTSRPASAQSRRGRLGDGCAV